MTPKKSSPGAALFRFEKTGKRACDKGNRNFVIPPQGLRQPFNKIHDFVSFLEKYQIKIIILGVEKVAF